MADLQGWEAVCNENDVSDGAILVAQVGDRDVAVVRVGSELFCIDAVCTHAFGFLDEGKVEGFEVECPLHGGRFDVRTGEPTHEPATMPIATYPLNTDGGVVYVRVDV